MEKIYHLRTKQKKLMHSQVSSIILPVPITRGTNALINIFKSERTQHNFRRLGQTSQY